MEPPRVWVLLGKGAGGNQQMRLLAAALGWPTEEKRLVYNPLERVPNLLRGATRLGLDLRRSDPLLPPWPDLVIGASRRSAPVARFIKRRSGARCVHLFHVQGPLAPFDLVVTLPQYRLPQRPNVLQLSGALNRVSKHDLARAAAHWKPRFTALPRPWIALIVGGDSSSYAFTPDVAARLGRQASQLARDEGGSLLITTTPRTKPDSTQALFAEIDVPAHRYIFQTDDPDNPYRAYLALADRFIVTVDSASLPMEACATGKPVQVFEWARKKPVRHDGGNTWGDALFAKMIAWGLVKPARDFDAYHRVLRERKLTSGLDQAPIVPRTPPDDLGTTIDRIRVLFANPRATS